MNGQVLLYYGQFLDQKNSSLSEILFVQFKINYEFSKNFNFNYLLLLTKIFMQLCIENRFFIVHVILNVVRKKINFVFLDRVHLLTYLKVLELFSFYLEVYLMDGTPTI